MKRREKTEMADLLERLRARFPGFEIHMYRRRVGEAYARQEDPDESQMSAEAVKGPTAAAMEKIVLQALLDVYPDGLSNHGICDRTGLDWGSASPRIKPLRRKGLVESREDVDGKPVRVYDSRRPSRVWFLTELGVQVARSE